MIKCHDAAVRRVERTQKHMASTVQRTAMAYTSNAVCLHCVFFTADQVVPVKQQLDFIKVIRVVTASLGLYLVSVHLQH